MSQPDRRSRQQFPGQPYSAQPYSAQPYSAQPYPAQSFRAQSPSNQSRSFLARLAETPLLSAHGPIAARFIHSLRLIALHERLARDPVPELAARLSSIEGAAKSLALGHAIAASWPENIHVSRFCCLGLTHDEATIGALVDHACARDRAGFEAQVEDLVRHDRIHRLWDGMLALIGAEQRAR